MEGVAYRCCRQSPVVFSEDNMHYAFRRDNSRLQRRLRSRQRQREDPAATRLFQSTPRFGRSVLLYLHRDRVRNVRDGSPGRPPRLSRSSWGLNSMLSSMSLYVHRDRVRTIRDGEPRTATSTFTQLLSSGCGGHSWRCAYTIHLEDVDCHPSPQEEILQPAEWLQVSSFDFCPTEVLSTHTHTHTHTHSHTHTHTRTHTHARTHAHSHTHTHTHTPTHTPSIAFWHLPPSWRKDVVNQRLEFDSEHRFPAPSSKLCQI